MEAIDVLILSDRDWTKEYIIPDYVKISKPGDEEIEKKLFDVTFIDVNLDEEIFPALRKMTKAHTVFYLDSVTLNKKEKEFYKSRKAKCIKKSDIQRFFEEVMPNYFSKPYGEKFETSDLVIAPDYNGKVRWNGGYNVELTGDFGEEYSQIAFFKNSIPIFVGQSIEFYLEYKKTEGVSIQVEITQFLSGYVDTVIRNWVFEEDELEDIFRIEEKDNNCTLFVSINAKGSGQVIIDSLHDRHSRRGYGNFLPGGERYVSENGEEIFAYFDPGDMKPPLNVYFSGFKTMEGFEGYNLMKSFGAPFLLIAEARLQGGAFYMGDDEYEQLYTDIIMEKADELGFGAADIIMSGLSMGTTGAMYHGCNVKPHAIIIGKPLASLGNVAQNELRFRPDMFATSIDVLYRHTGGIGDDNIKTLNKRMWEKVHATDFSNTVFAIAYMIEDDYDGTAYEEIINNLSSAGVTVYGKGLHGRHNDDTNGIVMWFIERFKSILREDFEREVK